MMLTSLVLFFTDSILRAPTIGCMLMCLAVSLIGVVIVLRRQSLLGEAMSHAAYPGFILGVIGAAAFAIEESDELRLSVFAFAGAFLTVVMGLWGVRVLVKYARVPADAALCFILSTFFGVGLTLASEVQFSFTTFYKQVLTILYGQAATMTDGHITVYGVFAGLVLLVVVSLYKELQAMTFDQLFAKSLGIPVRWIEAIIFFLTALGVIISIRSVGIILMSGMLIAPAIAARQWTHRLSTLFLLAALFGIVSGFLGNFFSVYFTDVLAQIYPTARIALPTGPMIVLTATAICLLSICFSPKGAFARFYLLKGDPALKGRVFHNKDLAGDKPLPNVPSKSRALRPGFDQRGS